MKSHLVIDIKLLKPSSTSRYLKNPIFIVVYIFKYCARGKRNEGDSHVCLKVKIS